MQLTREDVVALVHQGHLGEALCPAHAFQAAANRLGREQPRCSTVRMPSIHF
jgi:hypothetical protein